MARKAEENAISLFSFQDIITSITGIMFLVVLLLLLIAVTSRPAAKPAEAPARELQRQLDELRRQLTDCEAAERDLDGKLAELRKLSPEMLAARLAELNRELGAVRTAAEHAVREKTRLEARLAEQTRRMEETVRRRDELQRQSAERQQKLEERARELENARQQAERNARVVDYVVDRASSKNPVLAELGSDGIQLLVLSENRHEDFRKPGQAAESAAEFLKWVRARSAQHEYYSILVKPGGFRYAEALASQLREMGLERGLEILPDDRTTIFAEAKP